MRFPPLLIGRLIGAAMWMVLIVAGWYVYVAVT
jgi:hypothetical protein